MTKNLWHERKEYPECGKEILIHALEKDGHHYDTETFDNEREYVNYVVRGMHFRYDVIDWAYCDEILTETSTWRIK